MQKQMRRLLAGRNRAAIGNFLTMLHDYKPDSPYRRFMPPLSGSPDEIRLLGDYLDHIVSPTAPAPTGKAVASLH